MTRINRIAMAATLAIGFIVSTPAQAIIISGAAIDEQSYGNPGGPIADFVWDFTDLNAGIGPASLTLDYVRLDTDGTDPTDPYNEYFEILVDGILIGNTASVDDSTCVTGQQFVQFWSDCDGSATFSFDTALFDDGLLNVVVSDADTLNPVNALIDRTNGAGYAIIEIEYEEVSVPEPSTLSILLLGLTGMGYMRRRLRKE